MKAHLTLFLSALMASTTGLAAPGSAGANASAQSKQDDPASSSGLAAERDEVKAETKNQFRYDGGQQAARSNMGGRLSLRMNDVVSSPRESFAKLDRDGDGMISAGESTSSRPVLTQFDRADADGNRMLSSAEFDALVTAFEEEMAE